jgi:hypothetical protein
VAFVSGDFFFVFAIWACLGGGMIDWVSVSFRRSGEAEASSVTKSFGGSLLFFPVSLLHLDLPVDLFLCISITWAVSLAVVLSFFFVFPCLGGGKGRLLACFVLSFVSFSRVLLKLIRRVLHKAFFCSGLIFFPREQAGEEDMECGAMLAVVMFCFLRYSSLVVLSFY